jgi:DNA-3-methyladenine glycosylase II
MRKRPDAKRLVKIAEQWRPWRSAAALLLWHYRRNMPDWSAREPKPKLSVKEPPAKKATPQKKAKKR